MLCTRVAAFDTVDHNILLNRLKVLAGISGSAHEWFSSYLSARTLFDLWGPSGFYLGSIVILLLHAYFSRDHSIFLWHFFNHFYANDIQPYMSFKPYQLDRLSALVNSLSQISDWLANNSLVLNSDKTEAMIIAPPDIHLRTSQVIASFCSSVKTRVHNIFVVFDCSLSLDTHIKSISRSVLFL